MLSSADYICTASFLHSCVRKSFGSDCTEDSEMLVVLLFFFFFGILPLFLCLHFAEMLLFHCKPFSVNIGNGISSEM